MSKLKIKARGISMEVVGKDDQFQLLGKPGYEKQ